jgi:hypothetical protein
MNNSLCIDHECVKKFSMLVQSKAFCGEQREEVQINYIIANRGKVTFKCFLRLVVYARLFGLFVLMLEEWLLQIESCHWCIIRLDKLCSFDITYIK